MKNLLLCLVIVAFTGCGLMCDVNVTKKYEPTTNVDVIPNGQALPRNLIRMGSVTVGEGGFTDERECTYEACMREVLYQAMKVGADIVYIVKITEPTATTGFAFGNNMTTYMYASGSDCYGIVAELYKYKQ